MAQRLSSGDRSLLTQRPNIVFIEPDQVPVDPDPIDEVTPMGDVSDKLDQIEKLANAVNQLAEAAQARADDRAKNLVIRLDPRVDAAAVQAMRRRFPDDDPLKVTYNQYVTVREDILEEAEEIGRRSLIDPDDVAAEREAILQGRGSEAGGSGGRGGLGGAPGLGRFNSPEAADGGLRPELDPSAQIIEPLDLDEFSLNMVCILMNFLWKVFILDALSPVKIDIGPVEWKLIDHLPEQLCDPGIPLDLPGLHILGMPKAKTQEPLDLGTVLGNLP